MAKLQGKIVRNKPLYRKKVEQLLDILEGTCEEQLHQA